MLQQISRGKWYYFTWWRKADLHPQNHTALARDQRVFCLLAGFLPSTSLRAFIQVTCLHPLQHIPSLIHTSLLNTFVSHDKIHRHTWSEVDSLGKPLQWKERAPKAYDSRLYRSGTVAAELLAKPLSSEKTDLQAKGVSWRVTWARRLPRLSCYWHLADWLALLVKTELWDLLSITTTSIQDTK